MVCSCPLTYRGFEDYMASGVESTYQQLCSEITAEFNECSKQVSMVVHHADINPASGLFSKEGETGLEIGSLSHLYLCNNSSLKSILNPANEKFLLNCYVLIKRRRPSFLIRMKSSSLTLSLLLTNTKRCHS